MSQHPSLRSKQKGKKHRSVLKRYERVRELAEKEKWKEGDSVFGLLKLKILKFKLKKEKAVPAQEGAEGQGPEAGLATPAQAQGATKSPQGAPKGPQPASKKEEPSKEEKKK